MQEWNHETNEKMKDLAARGYVQPFMDNGGQYFRVSEVDPLHVITGTDGKGLPADANGQHPGRLHWSLKYYADGVIAGFRYESGKSLGFFHPTHSEAVKWLEQRTHTQIQL